MGDYKLKYGSYREFKEHRDRDYAKRALVWSLCIGVGVAALLSYSESTGTAIMAGAFAFAFTYIFVFFFRDGEGNLYIRQEFENDNLDEEMYRSDGAYRSRVEYLIAVESTKAQLEENKNKFVEENKNRFGK